MVTPEPEPVLVEGIHPLFISNGEHDVPFLRLM